MNKTELLRPELELIKGHAIRHFAEKAVEIIPDYIFTIPASSTGKYHPSYALGEGGLLRHIKASCRIAAALFRNDTVTGKFSDGFKCYALNQKSADRKHEKWIKTNEQ